MAEVVIRGRVILIDDEDVPLLTKHKWRVSKGYGHEYIQRWAPHKHRHAKMLWFHREIMSPPDDMEIDFINGNTLDVRKQNLRIVTHQENSYNRKLQNNNSSGVPGVWWLAREQVWEAGITHEKVKYRLGSFAKFEDAVAARKNAELLFHPDFIRQTHDAA